jgi:ankyrin repeat protein
MELIAHLPLEELEKAHTYYQPAGWFKDWEQRGVIWDACSVLHVACHLGQVEIVNALLCRVVTLEGITNTAEKPLWIASRRRHGSIVRELVKAGADTTGTLLQACWQGESGVVEELLAAGVKPEVADETGLRALHVASRQGHRAVVRQLLGEGSWPLIDHNDSRQSLGWRCTM